MTGATLLLLLGGCGDESDGQGEEVTGSEESAGETEGSGGTGEDGPPPTDDGGTSDSGTSDGGEGDTSDATTGDPPQAQCEPFEATTAYAEPGPFTVTSGPAGPDCTVFRPEILGATGPHPVILWGNGTTATPPTYAEILGHWASHGFVVVAANTTNAGSGAEMLACLDYLEAQAATGGSLYEGVLALDRVGASGHSQGGGGALMAGADPRVGTTAPVQPYTEQGFGGYDQASQSMQVGPMFMLSGGNDNIATPVPNQERVWETTNAPVLWGSKEGVGHVSGVIGAMDAFRFEITAWMRYRLMCDDQAAGLFVEGCSLCSDPEWTVQSTL